MSRNFGRLFLSSAAGAALLTSAAASAAASVPGQANPWLALTGMSSPAVAGTAAAIAQSPNANPRATRRGITAPPPHALAIILATLGLMAYIALTENENDPIIVSPE